MKRQVWLELYLRLERAVAVAAADVGNLCFRALGVPPLQVPEHAIGTRAPPLREPGRTGLDFFAFAKRLA